MWTQLSKWLRRQRYLRDQRKIQSCGLYIIGPFGLVLPTLGTAVTFPEEPVLARLSVDMSDADAIGAGILEGLDYAASHQRRASASPDYHAVQADFQAGMERYRQSLKIAQRKFEREMELINITRQDDVISVSLTNRAPGRYAFEGSNLAKYKASIAVTASTTEIGEAVITLYSCAARAAP